jgi:hypothetical protein
MGEKIMDAFETEAEGIPPEGQRHWPARPFLLAGLGLATGLVAHLILGGDLGDFAFTTNQGALLIGVTVGAALIGFTIERRDWPAALAFGAGMGLVAGFVTWWSGSPTVWGADQGETWRTMSLLLAVAIAAPLFQASRDGQRLRISYPGVHDHLWANVVLWCASWAFVGLTLIMSFLLASLFQLIKIEVLHDLLMKNWFWRGLVGLAFGSALGVLREHEAVVRTLQRVVTMLLAVLAPVLAIGLALFLIALPFTGVQALWDATSATTPLLLACAAGALILANDVIGAREADERRMALLRHSAMVLAAVILPLALLAAVATGLRIGQYGYTPERLWAIVFVGIAICWGAAYLGALLVGRLRWTRLVRPANLGLAWLVCALGFLLATPLISFNRISTADQVARLESGRTPFAKFDWRALAFDFGKPGRDALKKLAASSNPAIREKAIAAAKSEFRHQVPDARAVERAATLDQRLRILPAGSALPASLREHINDGYPCSQSNERCTLIFLPGGQEALLLQQGCFEAPRQKPVPAATPAASGPVARIEANPCGSYDLQRFVLARGKWMEGPLRDSNPWDDQANALKAAGYKTGQIEVRKVERRQVFVGGIPTGNAFQ